MKFNKDDIQRYISESRKESPVQYDDQKSININLPVKPGQADLIPNI